MLNITNNSISNKLKLSEFDSFQALKKSRIRKTSIYLSSTLLISIVIFLFLPWRQNIQADGTVNTRYPQQRPQSIQSVIAGRIEKWNVKEGDFVNKGDTIAFISEVKNEYFDPELVDRTDEQYQAKFESIDSYDEKINALDNQFRALTELLNYKKQQTLNKIEQAKNKIANDSIDLVALENNMKIAQNQYERIKELNEKGLKTLSELQDKELKLQNAGAKYRVQKNKLINRRNELGVLMVELSALEEEYMDKLSKSQSEKQSAVSKKLETIAEVSKLKSTLSNYNTRQQFYNILAPQSGYITRTLKKGIGETLKEGETIVSIMPEDYELAVEVYISPRDISLVHVGSEVKIRFDGWPAIIISGWPESATGVFTGKVVAIDKFINDRGDYRVIVSPVEKEKPWPHNLFVGTGAATFMLLNEVPVWYEIWRQLNGFPADYYSTEYNIAPKEKKEK
ncbi:MAG: HlyD family secretion protein [Chlorobiota bacterium]